MVFFLQFLCVCWLALSISTIKGVLLWWLSNATLAEFMPLGLRAIPPVGRSPGGGVTGRGGQETSITRTHVKHGLSRAQSKGKGQGGKKDMGSPFPLEFRYSSNGVRG